MLKGLRELLEAFVYPTVFFIWAIAMLTAAMFFLRWMLRTF